MDREEWRPRDSVGGKKDDGVARSSRFKEGSNAVRRRKSIGPVVVGETMAGRGNGGRGRGGEVRCAQREPIALHNEAKAIMKQSVTRERVGKPMRKDYCIYP